MFGRSFEKTNPHEQFDDPMKKEEIVEMTIAEYLQQGAEIPPELERIKENLDNGISPSQEDMEYLRGERAERSQESLKAERQQIKETVNTKKQTMAPDGEEMTYRESRGLITEDPMENWEETEEDDNDTRLAA